MTTGRPADGAGTRGGAGILEGIRVLDFSHQLSGPYATMILGDMGATVIKVESPGRGDGIRYEGRIAPEVGSHFFWGVNRNKRSITLDLKHPEGLAVALRLARSCDIVVENFRPGVMDKLGLSYEAVRAVNPDVVYLSITAFGAEGPMAQRPGMDLILQAVTGVMGITGEANDRPPVKIGPPIMDMSTALYGVAAMLLALFHRERTGQGQKADISMLDCGVSLMAAQATALLMGTGKEGRFGSGHPNLAPYQAYRDSRGAHFIVACLTNTFWRRLCARLGLGELVDDPRFVDMGARSRHKDELNAVLEPIFAGRPADEWVELLAQEDIPCARVNMPSEALALDQLARNGMVGEMTHPAAGLHKVVASPLHVSPPPRLERDAPMLGEHTGEILREFGYTDDEIEGLRSAGAV